MWEHGALSLAHSLVLLPLCVATNHSQNFTCRFIFWVYKQQTVDLFMNSFTSPGHYTDPNLSPYTTKVLLLLETKMGPVYQVVHKWTSLVRICNPRILTLVPSFRLCKPVEMFIFICEQNNIVFV